MKEYFVLTSYNVYNNNCNYRKLLSIYGINFSHQMKKSVSAHFKVGVHDIPWPQIVNKKCEVATLT